MSLPPTDLTPFLKRRQRVLAWMQAQGGGVAVLPTAPEVMRNRDADYPYRHDSDFFYLTGFIEPEAWLVLVADDAQQRSVLFCREKNLDQEIWTGYRIGPDAAQEAFLVDEAFAVSALDEHLPPLLLNQENLFAPLADGSALDARIAGWLNAARAQGRSGATAPKRIWDLRAQLAAMRLIKDEAEIQSMRTAARISAQAHRRAMQATRPGLHEYEIEAELLHEFRRHGAQHVAYNSIVATGANACVLHYRAGDTVLQDGELLLIDAGCEFDSYAGDITRSFPVNGRFSGPQRALYELCLHAQQAAIGMTCPGQRFNDAHDAAVNILAQGMLDIGLLRGSLDEVLDTRSYSRFYMHKTGHWLGLDVHDVGDYREADPANPAQRTWRTLEPGMVLTIEPGIYVRPADDVPEAFWDIGIRIEDDALVTADGCELLTRDVPVDPDEIETLMRG
ncbi:MAG: Xaa-Pro aminopeptidase [Pigmentiphaga sp.]|nr:Xaa-Pro aminopeptidase [Pigmentiphaga sp.]